MKYNLTDPKLKFYITKILFNHSQNLLIGNLYNEYIQDNYMPFSFEELALYSSDLEEAFKKAMINLLDICQEDPITMKTLENHRVFDFKKLDTKVYLENPYYQKLKFSTFKKGRYKLFYDEYAPLIGFTYDDLIVDEENGFREITPMGFLVKPFSFPSLAKDNITWMSLIPHEINTMKKPILEATGNVLVLGLGLGYFPYMIHNKNDVKNIDIVEFDAQIINIFDQFLLPVFENPQKINVIKDEAYQYLNRVDLNQYDYVFVDIYHNANDGIDHYFKIQKIAKNYPKTKFRFWIENSLICLVRRMMSTLIEEEVYSPGKYDYTIENNITDFYINRLHFLLEKIEIKEEKDLYELLKEDSLRELASKIYE